MNNSLTEEAAADLEIERKFLVAELPDLAGLKRRGRGARLSDAFGRFCRNQAAQESLRWDREFLHDPQV